MTRINLLPPERVKERRRRGAPAQRSYLWLVIALPVLVALLMGIWYFSMSSSLNRQNEALNTANKDLADIQAKTAALKKYQDRANEIAQTEKTVVQALSGRIYWARILNNVAIMCPLNIWLTSLDGSSTASSSDTTTGVSGTVTFQGYATQCPNRLLGGFEPGMLDYHPDYRPIAGWLERMAQIEQFSRVWLASAEPDFLGSPGSADPGSIVTSPNGNWVIRFSSTATLNIKTAAIGTVVTPAAAPTPTPSSSSPGTTGTGGTQ